ncbi:MAG: hypothetical protein PHZ09_13335 [Eubacteriales bacterium]|nr:hypothetical protein [Eubacteriales bacterium]
MANHGYIRLISLFIALITVLCAAACGQSPTGTANDTSTAQSSETADPGVSDFSQKYLTFDYPEIPAGTDYDGQIFTILGPTIEEYEEETGDVVKDAQLISRRTAEDKLGIGITFHSVNSIVDIEPTLRKVVQSGSAEYDLAINHCIHAIPSLLQQKLVRNWNNIENVHFDQPYWNQSLNDTLSVKGVLPIASGDYFMTSPQCIFFNKRIHNEYHIEGLYALVNDGKWTLDKFAGIAKSVSADLDGDGKFGLDDLYGMVGMADYQYMGFLAGCGQPVVEKDEEDLPTVALNNEKTYSIYSTLYSLIHETDAAYVWKYGSDTSTWIPFSKDTSLFEPQGGIGSAANLRDMDTDFGILPHAKYSEDQPEYISFELGSFLMVPLTAADGSLSGLTADLLCAENRKRTMPVYVDKLLVGKATRDNESEEMAYLILNTVIYDFGVNLGEYTDLSYILGFTLREQTSNFASYIDSRIERTNKRYAEVYDYYLEFLDGDY